MKGMIFTEFLEMVEEKFSLEMVDDILSVSYTHLDVYKRQVQH